MPAPMVKPGQEPQWERAKKLAVEQGQAKNWPYVVSIFQKLVQGEKAEDLTKAGPFIGPRGGKWADPKHTIPWKEPTGPTVLSDKEAVPKLIEMGDYLFNLDAVEERNRAGFNRRDYTMWMATKGSENPIKLRERLKKYRRQLTEQFGKDAFVAAGLERARSERSVVGAVNWQYHPTYGSLDIHIDASLPRNMFWELKEMHESEFGFRTRKRDYGFVYALENPKDFDREKYEARVQEILGKKKELSFPDELPAPPATAEERQLAAEERIKSASSPVDVVFEGLADRSLDNAVGMRYHPKEKTYEFRFPRGKISTLFSNRKGSLPTVTRWDTKTNPWSVHVFDKASADLALERIKELEPSFTIVTEGVETANAEVTRQEELNRTPIPEVASKLAPGMELFRYQNEGVRFLDANNGNALLGDEMGLGKTLQYLAWMVMKGVRSIAVVPNNVKRNWLREGEKFFPGHIRGKELSSAELLKEKRKATKEAGKQSFKSTKEKEEWITNQIVSRLGLGRTNLVTINYESVGKFEEVFKAAGFTGMVMDESHRIKNPNAKVTKAIQAISKPLKHRTLMSGTSVMNKRDEFLTQVDLIRPGLFPDKKAIREKTIGDMWDQMRGFYLARRKAAVLPDLPEKSTSIVESESSELVPDLVIDEKSYIKSVYFDALSQQLAKDVPLVEARAIAEEKQAEFVERFMGQSSDDREAEVKRAKTKAVGDFQRMRHVVAIAKVPQTVEFVQSTLTGSTSNMIVFTESKAAAKEIHKALGDVAVLHTGDQSDEQKDRVRGHFEPGRRDPESDVRVIVATRQSMAEGVTLTEADKVIFNDLPWTGAAVDQAESRAHRPGQENHVNVYWMQAKDNQMDQLIASIVQRKIKLHAAVNQGRKLSPAEQKWMDAGVSVKDLLLELEGKTAGPAESVSMVVETKGKEVDVQIDPGEPKPISRPKREPIKKEPPKLTIKKTDPHGPSSELVQQDPSGRFSVTDKGRTQTLISAMKRRKVPESVTISMGSVLVTGGDKNYENMSDTRAEWFLYQVKKLAEAGLVKPIGEGSIPERLKLTRQGQLLKEAVEWYEDNLIYRAEIAQSSKKRLGIVARRYGPETDPPPKKTSTLVVKPGAARAAAKKEAEQRRAALPKLIIPKKKRKPVIKRDGKQLELPLQEPAPQLKLFKSRSRLVLRPGTRQLGLERLVVMPPLPQPTDALDRPSGHFSTPEAVVSELGLANVHAKAWAAIIRSAVSMNEVAFRQHVTQIAREEGMDPIRRRALLGRALKYHRNQAPTGRKPQVFYPAELLNKGDPRGGSYVRRIPRTNGRGFTYFYDEEQYRRRPDAHISGEEGVQQRIGKAVTAGLKKAGKEGLSLRELKELAKKHGSQAMGRYLNNQCTAGVYTYRKERLRRKGN